MVIEHKFLGESSVLNDIFPFPCPQIAQASTQNYCVLSLNSIVLPIFTCLLTQQ